MLNSLFCCNVARGRAGGAANLIVLVTLENRKAEVHSELPAQGHHVP